jgi:hypothetical protein
MSQPPTGNPAFFGIKVSKPGIDVTKAAPTQLVYENDYTTTTFYDDNNSRVLLGQLPDGTYGMWVSQPGYDVTNADAAVNNELVFNSNQDIFRISETGSVNFQDAGSTLGPLTGSVASESYTFTKSYSQPPVIMAFSTIPSSDLYTADEYFNFTGFFPLDASITTYTDINSMSITTTKVTFNMSVANNSASNTYTYPSWNTVVQFYVLQQTVV